MKRKAETTQESTQQILTAELANVSEAAAVNLPGMNNMRRAIRSQRPRNAMPNPPERAEIPVFPQEYQTTACEPFLKYDSGVGDGDRILTFGTDQCFNLLSTSDNWFADGTFKSCLEIIFQIYMIHALVGGRIVPCTVVLPNKTEATYVRMFAEIQRILGGMSPDEIMFDFEKSAMNAGEAIFLGIIVKGCFYHLR